MIINVNISNAICDRTDTLTRYYQDIKKYRVLTIEEEAELFRIYHDPNSSEQDKRNAATAIMNANYRFAVMVAKQYSTNETLPDIINEANLAMFKALDKFDHEKGVKFIHYAVHLMRRDINNYCIKHNTMVRKNNGSKTYHVISKATNDFMQQECRKPTTEELAEILEAKYGVVISDLRDIIENKYIYIDTEEEDDDVKNIGDLSIYNSYTSSDNDYEHESNNDYNRIITQSLISRLDKREQIVLKMSFGIGEFDREYEIKEIAQHLKLTNERVRQIKISALEKFTVAYKKASSQLS
ncbi:MAG: sigma-70 family RNA polymerase sigma factor [Bacilli bacterium]|nr:sigma-70 family RNA polymerase sigma factor [Bacilli bacterium]